MTRIQSLIERNADFSAGYTPAALSPPTSGSVIISCLDHRLPPEIFLHLQSGDAPVIRNSGGRVTSSVINDLGLLVQLTSKVFGLAETDTAFEVAVIHHTQCGTGFLQDPAFRRATSELTGVGESDLAASIVDDPTRTVREDVAKLRSDPGISSRISVSGHVYDLATGRLTTVIDSDR